MEAGPLPVQAMPPRLPQVTTGHLLSRLCSSPSASPENVFTGLLDHSPGGEHKMRLSQPLISTGKWGENSAFPQDAHKVTLQKGKTSVVRTPRGSKGKKENQRRSQL